MNVIMDLEKEGKLKRKFWCEIHCNVRCNVDDCFVSLNLR